MNFQQWRESLDIFEKYNNPAWTDWPISSAGHDIIWTEYYTTDIPENSDDGKRLLELGWHVDREFDIWALAI